MNNEDKQLKHYINLSDALTLLLTDKQSYTEYSCVLKINS